MAPTSPLGGPVKLFGCGKLNFCLTAAMFEAHRTARKEFQVSILGGIGEVSLIGHP
jgi:hypothetical protein